MGHLPSANRKRLSVFIVDGIETDRISNDIRQLFATGSPELWNEIVQRRLTAFHNPVKKIGKDVGDIVIILLDQNLQDPLIATHPWIRTLGKQVTNLQLSSLAIAVDRPIALQEDHQRPGNVKVNQSVTHVVEVDAL